MTIQVTRKIEFDAGHRVLGHESKCAHLHGHRYVAEVTVQEVTNCLDKLSRVVDFSVIKTVVGGWVDENWDHNMLLNEKDPLLQTTIDNKEQFEKIFTTKAPYVMPGLQNPTAEVMSRVLFEKANELLRPLGLVCVHVRLYETPNCWAECDSVY